MAQFTQSTSTIDIVRDLRKRVAELERECKRLRQHPDGDAAICRAEPGSVAQAPRPAPRRANLGHCEWSPDTDEWLSCSEGLRRLLDVDAESRPSTMCLIKAVHPDDRRRYRDATERHRRAGQRYEIDYRIKRSDGATVEVREVSEPLPSANGGVTRWLSCVQDISGQGARKRHLQRDEEPYRDLVLGSMEGIGVVRGNKVLFANQALADILGYDNPEQLRAIDSTDILIAPHERARIKRHRNARLRGDQAPARYSAQYLRKDGEPIWLESVVRVVDWAGGAATQATLVDITQQVAAEKALKASEQRFKDFAEASSDWFWEMGPDLRFTWFSVESSFLGTTREEAGWPDYDPEAWRRHQADLRDRRPFKNFCYRQALDDNEVYVNVSGVPIFADDGKFLGYRGTGTDVSARIRAEREVAEARAMLNDAVESVSEGFAMFDKDDRLVLSNEGYRSRLAAVWDRREPNPTWPALFQRMVDRGLIESPEADLEAWIRGQNEAHHAGPSVRRHETGDGRFVEIRTYPTRDGGFAVVRNEITALKRAEEALRDSEQRFKDFAEASSDWFWEMGPDLRFSWFSDGASAAIGKTRPENSGEPADTSQWRDHLADLEARRPFKDFRYMGRDDHGTEICASVSGVPIFDTDGTFLGYRGTATDITAEVRAEQRAARAQAMLVDAIESIADGFSMFDRDDRLILVNQHHRRALAVIADLAVPGVRWETLLRAQVDRGLLKVPVEDSEAWIQEQLAAHQQGRGVRVHETLDGRWVEIRDYRTRDGGWAIVRVDITALKRAEAARKESERRFKDFAEASSDWFWEMGPDLRFTWFSHRLLKGTGIYTRKLIGKTRRMLGRSDTDARKWRAHIARLNAHRPFRDFRYRMRNDAGKDVFLSISGVPIFGPDNTFLGYRGTGKNITAEVLAEQRAAQAQAFLTDAIESIREGFAMFDKQDRLVLCNENFRKSLSAIADVLTPGMPWKTGFLAMVKGGVVKVPIQDREAWIAEQISMHRKPGCVRTMETASGGWRDVREYPTRDGGLVLIRADITEIKRAEMAIRESEALLKQATQMASLGHWVWDEQKDRCIHCSEGLSRMYGLTPDEYIAELGTHKTTAETVIEEDRERYDDVIRRALKLKKGYDIEFRERLADGSIRHMRERGDPVLNDAGALVRTVGIVQDITKHKRAEDAIRHARDELEMRVEERTTALRKANLALKHEIAGHKRTEAARRESRGLLEAIIEASVMGINVKGPDHRYVFMNAYQADVYGVRPEDAVGKTPAELIGVKYGEHVAPPDRRVIETGATIPYFEEEIPDKGGVLRTWLTTKIPVKDSDGALRYIVSTSLDITEVKARERVLKQAQKMEAVGKLTGGIAHDFNNLLFVIRGNVALLTDELGDSSAARECLGAIQDAAKLGADLTRSLLAFSRQQPLEPAVVHLPEVIAPTVATLLRPLEKNIQIETSYPPHVWPVLIDRHQIENALLNLALNARDAMPDGGHLRISVENRRSSNGHARRSYYMLPGDYVCLVVADTGVGMPPDVIEHAFEPFFTTKPAGSGTGLGLSMVYGFIKQSGGYIDIDSKLGQGTTITMHLPRTTRPDDRRPVPADHRRWVARGKETILVTEDDAAVRRVAVRILTKLGYTTREASNGAEALEILERDPSIDLLFADIVLSGGLNGAQLAREAQARLPKLKLLFASGYSQPAVLRETEGAGSIPLLSKPYDAEELGKLIRRLLDGGGGPRSR